MNQGRDEMLIRVKNAFPLNDDDVASKDRNNINWKKAFPINDDDSKDRHSINWKKYYSQHWKVKSFKMVLILYLGIFVVYEPFTTPTKTYYDKINLEGDCKIISLSLDRGSNSHAVVIIIDNIRKQLDYFDPVQNVDKHLAVAVREVLSNYKPEILDYSIISNEPDVPDYNLQMNEDRSTIYHQLDISSYCQTYTILYAALRLQDLSASIVKIRDQLYYTGNIDGILGHILRFGVSNFKDKNAQRVYDFSLKTYYVTKIDIFTTHYAHVEFLKGFSIILQLYIQTIEEVFPVNEVLMLKHLRSEVDIPLYLMEDESETKIKLTKIRDVLYAVNSYSKSALEMFYNAYHTYWNFISGHRQHKFHSRHQEFPQAKAQRWISLMNLDEYHQQVRSNPRPESPTMKRRESWMA